MKIKNKTIKLLLFVIPLIICAENGMSGVMNIPEDLKLAFKAGNAQALSKYFNINVELVIQDSEDVYSKAQAEQIVKQFFIKFPPNDFVIVHQGGKDDSKYGIGSLKTSKGNFRVYFLLKMKNGVPFIHQLRIEPENDN